MPILQKLQEIKGTQLVHLAPDSLGNLYLAGLVTGKTTVGTTNVLPVHLSLGGFLAKLNPEGQVLWAKQIDAAVFALAVERSGNMLIGGQLINTVSNGIPVTNAVFGDVTLFHENGLGFLSRINPDGDFISTIQLAGGVSALAPIPSGGFVIAGTFPGAEAVFGDTTLVRLGSADMYLAKANAAGDFVWATSASGGSTSASALALDRNENIYVTGAIREDEVAFGDITLTSDTRDGNFFIAKADAQGKWVFARQSFSAEPIDQSTSQGGMCLNLDEQGNIYISGLLTGAANFWGKEIAPNFDEQGRLRVNTFIAKISSSGDLLWISEAGAAGTTGVVGLNGMHISPTGSLYITGTAGYGVVNIGGFELPTPSPMTGYLAEISSDGVFQNVQTIPITTVFLHTSSSLTPIPSGGFAFLADTDLYLAKPFTPPSARPLLSKPGWSPNQSFQFFTDGEASMNYRIEISTDLRQWTTLTNYAVDSSSRQFSDPQASKSGQRFYRIVAE